MAFYPFAQKSENELLWTKGQLHNDGEIFRYGYVKITDLSSIFEATTDQIALLKNEINNKK